MRTKRMMGLFAIFFLLLVFVSCATDDGATSPAGEPAGMSGYAYAVFERRTDRSATFLACGAGGRLDRIGEDGIVETIPLPVGDSNLTSILVSEEMTIVAGGSGAIAYSHDGETFALASGAGEEYITGLTRFNEKYYASTYSGRLLASEDGAVWENEEQLTREPLLGIVSNGSYIVTATEKTDIIQSLDADNWESWNYNQLYEGLAADTYSFTNLTISGGLFCFIGHPQSNASDWFTVMCSERVDTGTSFRFAGTGKINDRAAEEFAPLTVQAVTLFGDSLLAACNRGRLLTIDPCEDCCLIRNVSDTGADMQCVALSDSGEIIFTGGDHFEFSVFSKEDFATFAQ